MLDIKAIKYILNDHQTEIEKLEEKRDNAIIKMNEYINKYGYINFRYELEDWMIQYINTENINRIENNKTLLHYMIEIDEKDINNIIKEVLQREDYNNIRVKDEDGENIMLKACRYRNSEIVENILMRKDITLEDIIRETRRGYKLWDIAIENEMIEIAKKIMNKIRELRLKIKNVENKQKMQVIKQVRKYKIIKRKRENIDEEIKNMN